MDGCSLFALVACFSWSNIYVDTSALYQDAGIVQKSVAYEWYNGDYHLQREIDSTYSENPYGRLALGYEIEFRHISWSLEVAHVSSLASSADRGINSVQLRARWRPFR